MKRTPFTRYWLLLSVVFLLALSACERPVPREDVPESPDAASTVDVIIIPTAPPATEEAGSTDGTGDTADDGASEGTTADDTSGSADTSETVDDTAADETTVTPSEQATVAAGGQLSHVVKSGETLGQIAQLYDISIADIAAANGITNIDSLDVGQELIIKAGAAAEAPGSGDSPVEPPPTPTGTEQVHIVQRGDNLFRIGLRYGFTAEELAAYNNIPNVSRIDVGQVIKIPPK